MNETEKLRALIPHWIEHNEEHADEFLRWAEQAGEAAVDIRAAADAMRKVNEWLSAAVEKLGGPIHLDHFHHHHD
jgi:uncharacterized tellurite resistance protein B-like protein